MKIERNKQFNRELFALAIPFALQGLLNALVGASDALMLGRLTQEAVAAVSLANQVSFVMSLFLCYVFLCKNMSYRLSVQLFEEIIVHLPGIITSTQKKQVWLK